MPIFSVVDIDEKLVDAAYPLVRTAAPDVSAEQWLDYVGRVRVRGGLLGLMGPRGSLFGLLTYRIDASLRHGRVFHIDDFIAFEFSRAAPGRTALCQAADALARQQGCTAIEVRRDILGDADGGIGIGRTRGWLSLGHRPEAVVFIKSLGVATEAAAAAPPPRARIA